MSARKINFYLETSDRLRSLSHAARRNAELDQVLVNTAPRELTQACRVKQLRDGTLTLLADNAAIAAKLKQLAARLLVSYQKRRSEITSIHIEVQVSEAVPPPRSRPAKARLSIESIQNLEALAERLEDSPLKQALTTMTSRHRKGG
jgi:hypothetical protein